MEYRKLGRTSSQRKALLRNQVTALILNEKIVTTQERAEEVQKIVERLITLAVKEKDNFETVTVKAKVARKDKDGKRIKEEKDGKKVTVYDEVEKEIYELEEREIGSSVIGELIMNKLKDLDAVAYVRFASVYREFKDVNTFVDELKKVLNNS